MFNTLKKLFGENKQDNATVEKPIRPVDLLPPETKKLYYEFDERYGDKAYDWYDKYNDKMYDLIDSFYEVFDYKKRIDMLGKAIKYYNDFYDKFAKHGEGGIAFLKIEYPQCQSDYTPDAFGKEYPIDEDNVNCARWLLQYYLEHEEEVTEVIRQEYIEYEYGSEEEYEEYLADEKHKKETKSQLLSLLKKNGEILQKDIYKEFPPDDKSLVLSFIADFEYQKKITKTKSGSTYLIHYNK